MDLVNAISKHIMLFKNAISQGIQLLLKHNYFLIIKTFLNSKMIYLYPYTYDTMKAKVL